MKLKVSLLLVGLLWIGNLYCRSDCYISCDSILITVTSSEREPVDSLKDKLHIECFLALSRPFCDTLDFEIRMGLPIAELGVRNLYATGLNSCDNTWQELTTENNGLDFKIIPKEKVIKINLSYDIHGFAFFLLNDSISFGHLFAYQFDYENLIAYNPNMFINKIIMKNSLANTLGFSYFDLRNNTNNCYNLINYGITVIDTTVFRKDTYDLLDFKYSVYCMDTVVLNKFKGFGDKYNTALEQLLDYVPAHEKIDIIATVYRSEELRSAFGRAFGDFFYCDTSFLSSPVSLLHESIHILFPCKPQKYEKGEYFLGESLTEWVANYLIKGEFNLSDTVNINGDLLNTTVNNQETWNLIYYKGPYLIENLSKETSKKSLYDAIMSFFVKYRNREVNFNNFISELRKKDYPEDTLNKLIFDLEN
jgi:hypothetical protein